MLNPALLSVLRTASLRMAIPWLAVIGGLYPPAACAAAPEIVIANEPMFDLRQKVTPNVLLSLSIDVGSVGVAYPGDYDNTLSYQGYFNPQKCYSYSTANSYFEINATDTPSTKRECGGKTFSGNFMNWASMSKLDLLRYGLTGGDRTTDTATHTVLQRAVLPATFYASNWFPERSIAKATGGKVSAPEKVTPFTGASIKLISCDNKILIADGTAAWPVNSPTSPAPCTAPVRDTSNKPLAAGLAGAYVLRIKVCDSAEASARTDLCKRFGDTYKPIGSLQRNAHAMRFGVMSYLPDGDLNRYGGVLRSPMKFLGPKKLSAPAFDVSDNENGEWDSANGVLYSNPDDAANRSSSSKSGMINFINQFGRSGRYKNSFDPLSELYYEGIRYFQGKAQGDAPAAESTLTEDYPVITSWTDPVVASCQRNEMFVVADAITNYDWYIPGNKRTDQIDIVRATEAEVPGKTPELDAIAWTRKLGEMESDSTKNPSPRTTLPNLDSQQTGYLKYGSYYISGLAYWANTTNIRLDKPTRVKTFVVDTDENGTGQVDANRYPTSARQSQLYLAAKYGGFDDVSGAANPFEMLASDGLAKVGSTNVPWDADGDGIPDNYFLASQPGTMVSALQQFPLPPLPYRGHSLSAPAVSSPRIGTASNAAGSSFLFQAGYRSPQWSGSLKKLAISVADSSSPLRIASTATWDAGALLSGLGAVAASPKPEGRIIHTAIRGTDGGLRAVEFKWDNLHDKQKSQLNTSPDDGSDDGKGPARVGYLRGVRSDEVGQINGKMRRRESVLGDLVNSNVKLVGPPVQNISGTAYKTFYEAALTRPATLYVGANDGMLHAFDADTGVERFAYVPSMLIPRLAALTSPNYAHRPYMDGQITVAEARVNTSWKTVLAAGLGGGAQGVFALDVTNPTGFGDSKVLFEFTDSDDPDMGNLMGAPSIAKFRTGVTNGMAEYKYYVVVPSGLNNHVADGTNELAKAKYSTGDSGALFLLSLDKAPDAKWDLGVNYYKIALPNLDKTLTMKYGVSSPALVVGSDGAVRYAYAGDLQGNLWRMKFTGLPPWSDALGASPNQPLFTAVSAANGTVQPITTKPTVVFAPAGGYVVLFGTGKFIENDDLDTTKYSVQSFYAVQDTTADADKPVARSALVQRTLTKLTGESGANAYSISGSDFSYGTESGAKRGWYINLPESATTGERQVTDSLVLEGQLYFNTIAAGIDPCASGAGRAYSMNALTGLSVSANTGYLSSVGFLSAPVLFQMGSPVAGKRSAIGRRSVSTAMRVLHVGTGTNSAATGNSAVAPTAVPPSLTTPAGRFSWREILNWQELRAEALRPR